jgi:hypothetical protein
VTLFPDGFWTGAAAGGLVQLGVAYVGRRYAAMKARHARRGLPACWGCNGVGYLLQPMPSTASASKIECKVCGGQGWTERPNLIIRPKPPGRD